jgi:hypothetical protein
VFHYEEATAEARVLSDTARLGPTAAYRRTSLLIFEKEKEKNGI